MTQDEDEHVTAEPQNYTENDLFAYLRGIYTFQATSSKRPVSHTFEQDTVVALFLLWFGITFTSPKPQNVQKEINPSAHVFMYLETKTKSTLLIAMERATKQNT